MEVALSMSHYGLAMYHLLTHAGCKALYFLGAGVVVIHASLDVQWYGNRVLAKPI